MRPIALFLTANLLANSVFASDGTSPKPKVNPPGRIIQKVIETSTGNEIGPGGIISPSSGMTVYVDTNAVARYLKVDGNAANDLNDLTELVKATNDGLREVDSLFKKSSGRDTTKLFGIVKSTNQIFKNHQPAFNELNSKLTGNVHHQLIVYFQETAALANKISQRLAVELPSLQVRLNQSRDPDVSRTPDVDLSHVFGPDALAAQKKLLSQLGLPADGGFTADQLASSIATTFKSAIQNDYNNLASSATKLASEYSGQFNIILRTTDVTDQQTWQQIKAKFEKISKDWNKLQEDFNTLQNSLPDSAASAQRFSSEATTIVRDAQTIEGDILSAKDAVGLALRTTISTDTQAIKDAKSAVQNLVVNVKKDAEGLFEHAKQDVADLWETASSMFGLANQYQSIATTYSSVTNGEATFTHTTKGLVGSDPTNPITIQSYDQLEFTVHTVATPTSGTIQEGKTTQIGDPYTIYGWNKRRGASVTAIGFFPRAQTSHWQYTAIQGWSYKFVSPGMKMDTIRTWVPGFGISIENLDQQANGQQSIGVGALITLFDERILGGYGYDTSGKGGYWYVGYRLRL